MRCWRCGCDPLNVYEVTTLNATEPEYLYGWPPATDHEHAAAPPTPAELADGGDTALARILKEWSR